MTLSAHLYRQASTPDGTFGRLVTSTGLTLLTGELPWDNNSVGVSCIPAGSYDVTWARSNKFGLCYRLTSVPKRSGILIHPANYCGFSPQELRGCIALGLSVATYRSKKMLLQSRPAILALAKSFDRQPFKLTISYE